MYRGPSKDASYQVLIHLARRFQKRRFFRNQPIRNKNGLWRSGGVCLQYTVHVVTIYGIDAVANEIDVVLKFFWLGNENTRFYLTKTKQSGYYLNLFHESNGRLYRGPSKDSSYQVLIHLARRFQRWKLFRNQQIRNKNGLWRPCLLTDRDEMSNLYRGPSVDASYQVSVQLA
jgi:hypothetical protein